MLNRREIAFSIYIVLGLNQAAGAQSLEPPNVAKQNEVAQVAGQTTNQSPTTPTKPDNEQSAAESTSSAPDTTFIPAESAVRDDDAVSFPVDI